MAIIFGDDGFCPQTMTINGNGLNNINIIDNNEDPIVQQMAIIQSYIEQAKQDHRYEEMRLLESNLKELEIEYFFAQQQQQQQQQSHESILYTNNEKSTSQVLPPSTSSMLNPFGDEDDDRITFVHCFLLFYKSNCFQFIIIIKYQFAILIRKKQNEKKSESNKTKHYNGLQNKNEFTGGSFVCVLSKFGWLKTISRMFQIH